MTMINDNHYDSQISSIKSPSMKMTNGAHPLRRRFCHHETVSAVVN